MFSVQFLMMNLIIISKKDKMKNKMMFWDPKKTKNHENAQKRTFLHYRFAIFERLWCANGQNLVSR